MYTHSQRIAVLARVKSLTDRGFSISYSCISSGISVSSHQRWVVEATPEEIENNLIALRIRVAALELEVVNLQSQIAQMIMPLTKVEQEEQDFHDWCDEYEREAAESVSYD